MTSMSLNCPDAVLSRTESSTPTELLLPEPDLQQTADSHVIKLSQLRLVISAPHHRKLKQLASEQTTRMTGMLLDCLTN